MKKNNKEVRIFYDNPRFSEIENVDFKKMKCDSFDWVKNAQNLLKYEGDFEDFLSLLESIKEQGFDCTFEKIFIHLDAEKKFYYVVEGNRRTLLLKLVTKELEWSKIKPSKPTFKNIDEKKWTSNLKKIESILNENSFNITQEVIERSFEDISEVESENIWKLLSSKHVGEQVGKRDWSRAKYFSDLLTKYKILIKQNKNNEEIIKELSLFWGKKPNVIKLDLSNAKWVIQSIDIYNSKNHEAPIDLLNIEISGYELVLSKTVETKNGRKNLREILGVKTKGENLTFDEKFSEKEIGEIITLLLDEVLSKNITTREIKDSVFDKFSNLVQEPLWGKNNLDSKIQKLKKLENKTDSIEKKILYYDQLVLNKIDSKTFDNMIKQKEYDSQFILAIKQVLESQKKLIIDFKKVENFPFPFLCLSYRNFLELLVAEFFYRIEDNRGKFFRELGKDEMAIKSLLTKTSVDINDIKNQKMSNIFSGIKSLCGENETVSSDLSLKIVKTVMSKYNQRLLNLKIIDNKNNIKVDNLISKIHSVLEILSTQIVHKNKDISIGWDLLAEVVHKPHYAMFLSEKYGASFFGLLYSVDKAIIELLKVILV